MRLPAFLKKDRDTPRKPWVFYLPRGLQVSSELFFLAILCIISGIAAVTGLAEPSRITDNMSLPWYHIWGGALTISGVVLAFSIINRDFIMEKLGARLMSILLATYGSWAAVSVGTQATVTLISVITCIFILEKRISIINIKLNPIKYVRNLPGRNK